ncbi:hypothetical protein [Alkalihalobacillus sp. 1P02AB]|uniref:hypothetical protein n=1 Tax=Alkalihalobacillus sp. 1P02AB TaxID=3132260 RepID=UPI0039A6411D
MDVPTIFGFFLNYITEQAFKKIIESYAARKQGIALVSENGLILEEKTICKSIIIWNSDGATERDIICSKGFFKVFNVWEEERTIGFHEYLSGMKVTEVDNAYIYKCNSGFSVSNFENLTFKLSLKDS